MACGASVFINFCSPKITSAIIFDECIELVAELTLSSQLICRWHFDHVFLSPLTQSGAPMVLAGIPNIFSIDRTSSDGVNHFCLPGNEAGESYTFLNASSLTGYVNRFVLLSMVYIFKGFKNLVFF